MGMGSRFAEGDRVWDFVRGWGVVVKIKDDRYFPVHVMFEKKTIDSVQTYTKDGSTILGGTRTLFFEEFEAPFDVYIRKNWRATVGHYYYFVAGTGEVMCTSDVRTCSDDKRYDRNNYFKAEAEAKESAIYKLLNGGR